MSHLRFALILASSPPYAPPLLVLIAISLFKHSGLAHSGLAPRFPNSRDLSYSTPQYHFLLPCDGFRDILVTLFLLFRSPPFFHVLLHVALLVIHVFLLKPHVEQSCIIADLSGARRRRNGGGPGEGCARRPVGTYLYLHAVGVGNHVAAPGLAR
jgi:hypothetical protein